MHGKKLLSGNSRYRDREKEIWVTNALRILEVVSDMSGIKECNFEKSKWQPILELSFFKATYSIGEPV